MPAQTLSPSLSDQSKQSLATKPVAFISVSDKTGIVELAKTLVETYGYQLISTGGTFKALNETGVSVIESSDITGFSELVGGRVKSLHPDIFAGILAETQRADDDGYVMPSFLTNLVIVNLYPFEKTYAEFKSGASKKEIGELVHQIDIGGVALIRAAAKNHQRVSVLCDPSQYEGFLAHLNQNNAETTEAYKRELANEAFEQTARYDSAISRYFKQWTSEGSNERSLPEQVTVSLNQVQSLRYGENPHQLAGLYTREGRQPDFDCLHGKALSYNNLLDMQAAWNIASEFPPSTVSDQVACVIIKHNNPTGVALATSPLEAFEKALAVDPISAFGGIVAFTQAVDEPTAEAMQNMFLDVILAPEFSKEALDVLTSKKNLRVVTRSLVTEKSETPVLRALTDDLFLVQQTNHREADVTNATLQTVSQRKATEQEVADMLFAWKVVKHVKSNAIVLAANGQTTGIGGGQTSRVAALENAITIMERNGLGKNNEGIVMASDAFLPHTDNIETALKGSVKAVIQPGGSIKDTDVIAMADTHNMAMVTTGVREFLH